MSRIISDPTAYGSRYDRALYFSRLSEGVENSFTSEVQKITSALIERYDDVLRPAPRGFIRNPHAELIDTLSEEDSQMLFLKMTRFCKLFGLMAAEGSGIPVVSLAYDVITIKFLSWIARNRHDTLVSLMSLIGLYSIVK